jgi:hypothetical protein
MTSSSKAARRALIARGIPIAAGIVLIAGITACSSTKPGASASSGATTSTGSSASTGSDASPSRSAVAGLGSPTVAATIHPKGPKKDIIQGLLIFEGEFRLSGAKHLHSSFDAFPGVRSPASSCSHVAATGTPTGKGQGPLFAVPAPPLGGTVSFAAEVAPYRGPGTYGKSSIVAVSASVMVGSTSYNLLAPGASVSVTFTAQGSGELKFHRAAAGSGQPTLSGTIRWSCSVQV